MNKLLDLLENNARLSNKELAVMLGKTEEDIYNEIKLLEESGVLKGYKAIIDKDKA
ncbi:MAG: Lrp/AsnC family transcriptional regulator, partial [Eubacterium sp.]|nr:Lrp/AsnC family transcriptional regulator [Eubacterium sp.]